MNAQQQSIKSYNKGKRTNSTFLMERTAALVAAYVCRNAMPPADIPNAIRRIHAALSALNGGAAQATGDTSPTEAEIAASIRYDRLVSFIDGKAYKSLKRHLTAHGMTPSEYQRRYGLPSDYPMVSPAYAKLRSGIARRIQAGFKAA